LAIHAKGGESISPKQKDRRTTTNFSIDTLLYSKGRENSIFQIGILKPSWTLREFCLSQRKSIWNKGRKFQILKMLLKILIIHLWLFAKELWK
jgi:hypothetical protein